MSKSQLTLIEACDRASEIVCQANDMERLYRKAVRYMGHGEVRTGILNMAVEAIEDEVLRTEAFAADDGMLSFFCGIWIQFLLVEIAGIEKEKLKTLAQRVLNDIRTGKALH